MSIVALKKKYLESKNISHNKQFSLNSRQGLKYCRFNMGSFSQTSVKSSSYLHNRRKQWKSLMVNNLPENFNGDPSAFKHICNNWVQTTGADENYIENKAITAICDNSNNALIESNYCNISKKIGSEPSYISKKVKTLECSKNGFNRPFPYNVSSSKPSFITCKDKPVQQIYNAHEYYGFNENYYEGTQIVDMNNNRDTLDTDSQSNLVVEAEADADTDADADADADAGAGADAGADDGADADGGGGTTYRYTLTASGSHYVFTGHELTNSENPKLTININDTLVLINSTSNSNHPLIIQKSDETRILGPFNQDEELLFEASLYGSGTYQYKCTNHSLMQGDIIVSG